MKEDIISSMLSDPECDPTSWLGQALVSWIKSNPGKLISDQICRKYVIAAMEPRDVHAISSGVAQYYYDTKDLGAVEDLAQKIIGLGSPKIFGGGGMGSTMYASFVLSGLGPGLDSDICAILCKLETSSQPTPLFLDMTRQSDLKVLLDNWIHQYWDSSAWHELVSHFDKENISHLVTANFFRKLDSSKYELWPSQMQKILRRIFYRIPPSLAKTWLSLLENFEFLNVWGSYDTKHLGKWVFNDGGGVKINNKLCPCGLTAKSAQGFTLHRNTCGDGGRLLYTEAAIRVAMLDPSSLICPGCGKKMKTKSGLTLHQKKCEPDPHYDTTRKIDSKSPNNDEC